MTLSAALAAYLQANRDHLNATFVEARRFQPALDPDTFSAHVRETIAPIVEAVAAINPGSVPAVAGLLYDLSLDLVGRELLGPRSRNHIIEQGWRSLLPGVAVHVASRPLQVVASITNALANMSAVEGTNVALWIDAMLGLGKLTADTGAWLAAGQVAAWRVGMAHLRLGALELCRTLEPALVCAALGLQWGALDTKPVAPVIDRLVADPWLTPELALTGTWRGSGAPTIKRMVGAFRGFGGLFLTPPPLPTMGPLSSPTARLLGSCRLTVLGRRCIAPKVQLFPNAFPGGRQLFRRSRPSRAAPPTG
jgi:hypothetical protein